MKCLIHSWFYISASNGMKNPFTGRFLKREDRFCQDCGITQLNAEQFSPEQRKVLIRMAKVCPATRWITFKDGDEIDKLTWKWLKSKITEENVPEKLAS